MMIRGSGGGGGKKGGGGGEAKNTLRSKNKLRLLLLVSEGKTGGLKNGAKSIYANDVPLQNDDDSYNLEDISYETRTGLPDQTPLKGFPAVEAEVSVGIEIKKDVPVVQAVTNLDATSVRVKIRVPSLTKTDTENGSVNGNSVEIAIDLRNEGGVFSQKISDKISGKCTAPYERSYLLNLTGDGPWYIRARRISNDSNNTTSLNQTYWSSFTIIEDYQLIYPDSALIGLVTDAESLGSTIPNITVGWDGIEIEVPTNFDPIARTYSGIWDGTFKLAVTDDPAWIFRDLIVNDRYGLGQDIDPSQVDKWALYEISQYCCEQVPDGYGGMEPRFTFNATINERDEAIRILVAMAGVFRGIAYWGAGTITAVADKPTDVSKLVTPANVIDGVFTYQGSSLSARHTQATAQFVDIGNNHKVAQETYEDPEAITIYGVRPTSFQAIGCRSRGMARRYAKWLVETEKHESEVVTYRTGLDHSDVAPGDIVHIADPSYAGVRYGGRLADISEDLLTVTLDDFVALEPDQVYSFSVVMPDGSIADRSVLTSGTQTKTLLLSEALTEAPESGAMWLVTGSNAAPRPFRIISVQENEKHQFDVVGLFYDETKFARVEQDIVLDAPIFSAYPTGALKRPTNLVLSEYLYLAGGTSVRTALSAGWTAPTNDARVSRYEVEIKRPGLEWEAYTTTAFVTIDIQDLDPGTYSIRVRSLSDLTAARSQWTEAKILLNLVNEPPADVTNLRISTLGDYSTLSWDPVASLNFSHYVVKFTPDIFGAGWGSSAIQLPHVDATSTQVPTRRGTYLVKAVSRSGVESDHAALVTSTENGAQLNAVEQFVEQPLWSGEKNNVIVIAERLRLRATDKMSDWTSLSEVFSLYYGENGVHLSGSYESDQTIDLGEIYTSRITPILYVQGSNIKNVMSSWTTLSEVESLSGTEVSNWSADLQIRYTLDDPTGIPLWTEWETALVGDVTARAYQMRLLLSTTQENVTPIVSRAEVTIDMPDRIVDGNDITVPVGGLRISFVPPYRALKGVGIMAQGLQTGDYWEITDKDNTGFDIVFKNSSGTEVSRTLDYVATGYGRVL